MQQVGETDADQLAALQAWGGASEMSAFEGLMWMSEIDPRLRSTGTGVLCLDRVPDWERFLADHRWLVEAVPRLRQKVVVPALGAGLPTWVTDPGFNLDYHLRRMRLPEPGTQRQLLDAAAVFGMTPPDKARPPWEAVLVEGLQGGKAAYLLKMHHAMSDGLGFIQLLGRVYTRERDSVHRPQPHKSGRVPATVPSPEALAIKKLTACATRMPRAVAEATSGIASFARRLVVDASAAQESMAYLQSAKRMLAPGTVPGSGLFKRRSMSWRYDTIELPLAALKSAAKAVDASINDIFLAGVMGGFRRYHEEMGVDATEMPLGFPVSLRTQADGPGGNKFTGAQYVAPVAELDPVARVRHVQAFVKALRAEPALDVMPRLMSVVAMLPISLVTRLTGGIGAALDAQISNFAGVTHPVYFAGAEVTHTWPFGPLPGCPMMITLTSHNGRCCIGINSDRAAVTEPELLIECLNKGFEEVLALGTQKKRTRKTSK